jgi:hypothetical protein
MPFLSAKIFRQQKPFVIPAIVDILPFRSPPPAFRPPFETQAVRLPDRGANMANVSAVDPPSTAFRRAAP